MNARLRALRRPVAIAVGLVLVNELLARALCALHVVEKLLSLSPGSVVVGVLFGGAFLLLRLVTLFVVPGWALARVIEAVAGVEK